MTTERLPGMPGPKIKQLETRENIRGAIIQLHVDQDLESVISHMNQARASLWKIMESTSHDPRMVMLARDVTALWHILVGADFTVLRVREKWETFKESLHPR